MIRSLVAKLTTTRAAAKEPATTTVSDPRTTVINELQGLFVTPGTCGEIRARLITLYGFQRAEPYAEATLCVTVGKLLCAPCIPSEMYAKSGFLEAQNHHGYTPAMRMQYLKLLIVGLKARVATAAKGSIDHKYYTHALAWAQQQQNQ